MKIKKRMDWIGLMNGDQEENGMDWIGLDWIELINEDQEENGLD